MITRKTFALIEVEKGGAAGEDMGVEEREADEDEVEQHHQQRRVLPEGGAAEEVVDPPGEAERDQRDRDRLPGGEIHRRGVDQEEIGAEVVDKAKEREAREPGRIAFPLEPDQVGGHPVGRHEVFLDMVEAAAVDLPFLAVRARGEGAVAVQPKVERDEVEGRADPGDGSDDMEPAHGEFEPVEKNGRIGHRKTSDRAWGEACAGKLTSGRGRTLCRGRPF
jgi:hypothetical protein